MDVTIVILTKNEESNLTECIESVKELNPRVVVVDCGSTDSTVQIAEKMGAEVLVHPFETYAKQFNWALDHANIASKWSMRLDADERLTPALCTELEELTRQHEHDDVNGITMEAWLYFLGRKIKYGCHNKRKIMLFKTGVGRIEDRKMDEHTVLREGTAVCAKQRFIHYDVKDLRYWIHKLNWYAYREMQDYYDFKEGKNSEINGNDSVISGVRKKKFGIYYRAPMFLRCWLLFIYNYIFRLGFLDGKEGFVYNFMYHLWYRTLVDARILEHEKFQWEFEQNTDLK